MEMNSSRDIAADVDAVWAALLSPAALQHCVSGCKEIEGSADTGFTATVVQKVGPVKATFKGQVDISDMQQGRSLTLSGQGKGGAAGFAKGAAYVTLTPSQTGCLLEYKVEAKVGGKLAQLGSRIIDGFAKKMADEFFNRLQEHLQEAEGSEGENGA